MLSLFSVAIARVEHASKTVFSDKEDGFDLAGVVLNQATKMGLGSDPPGNSLKGRWRVDSGSMRCEEGVSEAKWIYFQSYNGVQ